MRNTPMLWRNEMGSEDRLIKTFRLPYHERCALSSSTGRQQWAACLCPGRPFSSAPERALRRSSRPGTAGHPRETSPSRARPSLCRPGRLHLDAARGPLHLAGDAPAKSVDNRFVVVYREAEGAAWTYSPLQNCHCPRGCCNTPLVH